jgi:hypothetical protein
MRHPFLALTSAALILTAPAVVTGQQVRTGSSPAVDSLTAQLVDLELQRVSSTGAPSPQTASARDISSQIAALHERLRALPDGAAADREASDRVLLALDARAASVHARLQELRLFYTDTHPLVRQTESEQRAIDERRIEIRRTT